MGAGSETFSLRVRAASTIADIRSQIEAKVGPQLPPGAVFSSGEHRYLPGTAAALSELGIGGYSVVVLSQSMCGGGCTQSTTEEETQRDEVTFHDVGSGSERQPADAVSSSPLPLPSPSPSPPSHTHAAQVRYLPGSDSSCFVCAGRAEA